MNRDGGRIPDFGVPSPARIYDYLLGGKDNFFADREAALRLTAAYPDARKLARANRRFLIRAVWYMADHGIRQYIDLGSGLPTSPNVHEVARQVRADARIVYVDNDPMVAAHGRALCADKGVAVVEGDIRYPQDILTDRRLTDLIDFSAPVAFLCAAVLHFIRDEDNPKDIVAALRWRMTAGSYLVISHAMTDQASEDVLSAIGEVYRETSSPAVPRKAEDIEAFFAGLDLIEPGLVDVSRWRSNPGAKPTKTHLLAGVGRKPKS